MRRTVYWSLAGVAAALLMPLVAPAVYGAHQRAVARFVPQTGEPMLQHPAGGVALATERMGVALLAGSAPPPVLVAVDPQPRRGDVRSQPTPRTAVVPLLWVGGDMTAAMATGEDPGAVLPPYERDAGDASAGRSPEERAAPHERTPALSIVTVLLGPGAVTGLSTPQHSVLGGPEPGERLLPQMVRVRPRFARGGMQLDVSWAF